MDVGTFAAERRGRLAVADESIAPSVVDALLRRGNGDEDWYSGIVDAAARIWLENYQAEAPGARHEAALARFRASMEESLAKTSDHTNEARITRWAATLAVNAGTINGGAGARMPYKMWVTMEDADVRDIHRPLNGKIVPMGSTFDVEGSKLPYPGAPVGPYEVWIECRCVAMPAAREGQPLSMNAFAVGLDVEIDEEHQIVSNNAFASVGTDVSTYAAIMLIPAEGDPINAASSEDGAHVTAIWMGKDGLDPDLAASIHLDVREYAADLDGPVVVPVAGRGVLGDDEADVAYLEPTDSLVALRDGLLDYGRGNVRAAFEAAEQYPEWTPHVTLGYPETPALGEYDATEVVFDRIGLWLGNEHFDYPMGGTVSDTITAGGSVIVTREAESGVSLHGPFENRQAADAWILSRAGDVEAASYDVSDVEDPPLFVEDAPADVDDDVEDAIDEIPIHGVLAPEGVETGDNRGFRPGALSTRRLPVPFRTEVVGSHGGNQTSEVVDAGRIDEAWLDEPSQMWRFKGALVMSMPGAAQALEGIITGVRRGVSIDADQMADDIESYTEEYIEAAAAAGKNPTRWFKSARVAGLTHVPIPAFEEAYVALGHEFEEDMTDEQVQAGLDALAACGCLEMDDVEDVSDDPERNAAAQAAADALDAFLASAAFKDYDTETRKRMAGNGQAMPDGSFPIADEQDLRNAIQSIGRASDPDAAKAHIKKRAQALGKTNLLPQGWGAVATGGILSGEKRVLVGEHGAEWIIPLSALENAGVNAEMLARLAVGTKDGPGWITHPKATKQIRDYWTHGEGAAKIAWGTPGDFNRCRAQLAKYVQNPEWLAGLCANMHYEVLKTWPGVQRGDKGRHALIAAGGIPAPILTIVADASAPKTYPAEWFADPKFDRVTPLTIDKATGRVYGHLAQWNACHIGIAGACTKPPHSKSSYSNFLRGVVDTDAGEQAVGTLTYGIGHANPMLRAASATAHYDQVDAVFAFVNIGEDKHGIWYAGVLRPGTSEDRIDDIRAIGSLSGDWRRHARYGLDLVAAVSVNTPGYSLAASGGMEWEGHGDGQMTALGLGLVDPREQVDGETHEDFVTRVAERALAIVESRQRLERARARVNTMRLADARRRIEGIV